MGSRYIIIDNGTIKRTDVDRDSAVFADNVNDAVTQKRADKSAMLVIPDTYKELSFIEENEYKEFEDYIFSRYFGKKTVVVYGNCHTTVISDYLENCAEFKQEYILYRIKPIQTIDDTGYFDHPIFRYCDVFVHQSIQLKNRYGEEYASENIVKRLKPECRVISIPNVYGLPVCFFPQYIRDTEYKNEVGITVFFRDSLLDALGNKHIFPGKIYKEYISDKSFSDEYLEDGYRKFLDKVSDREKEWDIKCLSFISDNYRKIQLFYDPNHPTNEFLLYVTKQLLHYLEIEFDEDFLDRVEVGTLTTYEMPVLPEVKKYFGMTFCDNKRMRLSGGRLIGPYMDVKGYVYQYLAYIWQNNNAKGFIRRLSLCRYRSYRLQARIRRKITKILRKNKC